MQEFKEKPTPTREAVMFLIYQNGKLLFERRKDPNQSYFGYTIIPGGKVEKGESPEEAMRREIKEEKDVDVKRFILLDSFEDISPHHHHYLVHAYLILGVEGEIRNNENKADNVWVSLTEAWTHARFANNRYALTLARAKIITEEGLKTG